MGKEPPLYVTRMVAKSTLLCLHHDPVQLGLLEEHGYELVTAANGHEGLRLFMSRSVDAIVLEYYLGLLDGVTIASVIKQVRPEVPIVMLSDPVEIPGDALRCIDAIVAKSDGPHFLLATIYFLLNVKRRPIFRHNAKHLSRSKCCSSQNPA
jgi:DNA-binding response OmpR family regulator